jgi:hypothetical protein
VSDRYSVYRVSWPASVDIALLTLTTSTRASSVSDEAARPLRRSASRRQPEQRGGAKLVQLAVNTDRTHSQDMARRDCLHHSVQTKYFQNAPGSKPTIPTLCTLCRRYQCYFGCFLKFHRALSQHCQCLSAPLLRGDSVNKAALRNPLTRLLTKGACVGYAALWRPW